MSSLTKPFAVLQILSYKKNGIKLHHGHQINVWWYPLLKNSNVNLWVPLNIRKPYGPFSIALDTLSKCIHSSCCALTSSIHQPLAIGGTSCWAIVLVSKIIALFSRLNIDWQLMRCCLGCTGIHRNTRARSRTQMPRNGQTYLCCGVYQHSKSSQQRIGTNSYDVKLR